MRKILLIRLIPFLLVLLVTACDHQQEELRFHILNHDNVDDVALQEIFSQQAGITATLANGQPGQSALNALQSGETDLALVNRTRPFTTGVRAIMPVYKSVLHLLVPDKVPTQADSRSLAGKRIYIVNNSMAGRRLVEVLAERQNLSSGDYELLDEHQPGTTDLIIYLGPIDPGNPFWQAQPGNCRELKKQLFKLEEEAFASLINEKLAANESFRIFTDLLARIHSEIDKTGGNPPS